MPLKPTIGWEMPRNVEEICDIFIEATVRQWTIPTIYPDPNCESYLVNDKVSSFIVESRGSKYKVTIQEIE